MNLKQQSSHSGRRGQAAALSIDQMTPSHTVVFKRLIERFPRDRTINMIDLARVIESNIEFFFGYDMRLHYPDFTHLLCEMRSEQRGGVDESALKAGQQLDDDGYVFIDSSVTAAEEPSEVKLPPLFADLVDADCALVWDLLQYLNRPEVTELSRKLAASMKSGGLLYLVNSTHAKISMEPMFCTVQDESHILFSGCDAEEWISPGYSQREIIEMMPEFHLMHATLLQNGLQEMLLEKKP